MLVPAEVIVSGVNLAVAVVVDFIPADLDATIGQRAMILTAGCVGLVQIPPIRFAIAVVIGTLVDGAMGIRRVTGSRAVLDAFGAAVDHDASIATATAIGDARAQIHVFVAQAVAVVVAVVASRVIVSDLGARVFATVTRVLVQIEPVLCALGEATSATLARSAAPLAGD